MVKILNKISTHLVKISVEIMRISGVESAHLLTRDINVEWAMSASYAISDEMWVLSRNLEA